MATYVKTVLPSGRGLWLEKLTTKQYRAVTERVAQRLGDNASGATVSTRLGHELLLASLRGVTKATVPVQMLEDGSDVDLDKMLADLPEDAWVCPTYEQLILEGPLSIDALLEDPSDYLEAQQLATQETIGGRAGALRGKVRREYGAR